MKKSIFCGLAATVSWGLSNVLAKMLLAHFEPLSLLAIQLIASNALLWIMLAFQAKSSLSIRQSFQYSLPGILQPGLAFVFGMLGLNLTTANSDSLIWATESIAIIFLASLMLREPVGWYLLMLSICGIGGTLLATTANFDTHIDTSMLFGNMLILVGVVCGAFYNIYTQRQLIDIDPFRLTALHQLAGLILVIGIWLMRLCFVGGSSSLSGLDFLLAIISGITAYALPFVLYLIAMKDMGAARTSILLGLPPVFTICGSFVFLGERLNYLQWVGVIVALFAVSGICLSKGNMIPLKIIQE